MNMERRKKPLIGDLVNLMGLDPGLCANVPTPGIVVECVGIHLWIRLLAIPWAGHSGREYVRRDSVDVISRARQ